MSNWTATARAALEGYLDSNRATAAVAGADGDEVIADLRRHVEEEAAALKLSVITEQDVRRIVSRIGPVPELDEKPLPPPSSRTLTQRLGPVGSIGLLFFGVILPLGTLIFELATHLCAGTFFDPISTWFHVLLVLIVPVANLFAWLSLRDVSKSWLRWIWLGNGAALGVCLFYAALYLPMSPFAFVGVLFFGLGLLPLSPLFAAICTWRLRVKLRREMSEREGFVSGGWRWAVILPAILLILLALPGPLTRHWIDLAGSESSDESIRAVKLLRSFGSEDAVLKECYGRTDRLWLEMFGGRSPNPAMAQQVFYRVTGKSYNQVPPPFSKYQKAARDLFGEFEWDDGLGGEAVAGQVKGLSLLESRMDGICKPEEGWAYVEWIQEFRNDHPFSQREARAQIQLPPGGVVSRLTLWVNGEEREAAFAGRGEVRQAYQKVAVQQRRDPVLVTTSGPDRVLMQCFPIPPKGGTMKIRIGMTIPLGIESTNRAALSLPSCVERNFRVSPAFEHSVWLESSQPVSGGSKKLDWIPATNGKPGIRGQLTEANLISTDGILWFDSPIGANVVHAVDRKGREPVVISQTVAPMAVQLPNRIAIVLDGSDGMNDFFPKIAKALDGVPGEPELSIWLAQDGLQNVYNSTWQSREPASSAVARLKGFGGHDNVAGLLQAWEWTAARSNGVVVWIHGAQPVLLNGIESLKQRLDWRGAGEGPVILDVPVERGPNSIVEKIAVTSGLSGLPRFGDLNDDLERLFCVRSKRRTDYRFVRVLNDHPESLGEESSTGSSHIVRLWAFQEIKRLIKARRIADAVKLANLYQLVTPISGAVVLETKEQFADAGLTPADPASVPTIPEPSTWILLVVGVVLLSLWKRIRRGVFGRAR